MSRLRAIWQSPWTTIGISAFAILVSAFNLGVLYGQSDWMKAATTWERLYWSADDEARGLKMKLWECESVKRVGP